MNKSVTAAWEYKEDYFVCHNGSIKPNGSSFRRFVCIDRLYYNDDGTLQRIQMTSEGI